MGINPEIIPENSQEGLNANKTPIDFVNLAIPISLFILIVFTLKIFFQGLLIFLGLRFIWKLASG